MILIIDNYDSFTYNLYQYIGELNPNIEVYRNDKITIDEILSKNPTHIVLSPGPGYPVDAGICIELTKQIGGIIPILGVCLGHQAIAEAFGGKIVLAGKIMHGKSDTVNIDNSSPLFIGLPDRIKVGRYHSLIAKEDTLPTSLKVIGKSDNGEIMAISHTQYNVFGLQFHPESILTPLGKQIIKNFLAINGGTSI